MKEKTVCRSAKIKFKIKKLPKQFINELRKIYELYKRAYVHLFWCNKLGIEPDENVKKMIENNMSSYVYKSLLNKGSAVYHFKHIPRNVKKTFVKNVIKLDTKVLTGKNRSGAGYAVRIDLVKNTILIKGFGNDVILPLPKCLKRWLRDVLSTAKSKVTFTSQLILKKKYVELVVTACREINVNEFYEFEPRGRWVFDLTDVNSMFGIKSMYVFIDFDKKEVKLLSKPRYKPPSHRKRREYASYIQKLLKRLDNIGSITDKQACRWRPLYKQTLRRIRFINTDFVNKTIHDKITKLLRYCEKKNANPFVLIDVPDYEILQGDVALQQTLLRFVNLYENRLKWCGIKYVEEVGSSTKCFICGRKMTKIGKGKKTRLYYCPNCEIVIDRDENACLNLLFKVVPRESFIIEYFKKLFRKH